MADASYGPLVYMKQGSTELVVASSGLATIEDGGALDVESGGQINVESGGHIDVESGGYIDVDGYIDVNSSGGYVSHYVSGATSSASGSTTLSILSNSGVSFITSSGDTRVLYLQAPVEGVDKKIYFTAGSTGTIIYIDAMGISTGTVFESTNRYVVWEGTTGGAAAGWLHLVGHSTSKWLVVSKTTDMTQADTSS